MHEPERNERKPSSAPRMTSLAEEVEEQRRWRLKPARAGMDVFDALVANEFRSPDEHRTWQRRALTLLASYVTAQVPYYAALFARLRLPPADIGSLAGLARLPLLTKQHLFEHGQALHSRRLPTGESLAGASSSSGTTGAPAKVLHTAGSLGMFAMLRQRNCRWFRLDPMQSRVEVRPRFDIARQPDGSVNPDGVVVRHRGWRFLEQYFETGPEYGFNVSNPMPRQVAWLRELRPAYAMSYPGTFEEWLLESDGQCPADSLRALLGIGSQLTHSLRRQLERGFGIPIHMSYGLNEIGMVAVCCDAGRYHVNAEHCLVEITRADGEPCRPGEVGHVVVTGLRNFAMPLLRYDTGDLAEAVDGDCPCGRTLPAFGEIEGRFRRYAGLPQGTREKVRAVRLALEAMSAEELAFLRQYQLHQDADDQFTLRVRAVGDVPAAFADGIQRAWEPVARSGGDARHESRITIVTSEDIDTSPSGKPLDFTSDIHVDAYVAGRDTDTAGPADALSTGA